MPSLPAVDLVDKVPGQGGAYVDGLSGKCQPCRPVPSDSPPYRGGATGPGDEPHGDLGQLHTSVGLGDHPMGQGGQLDARTMHAPWRWAVTRSPTIPSNRAA